MLKQSENQAWRAPSLLAVRSLGSLLGAGWGRGVWGVLEPPRWVLASSGGQQTSHSKAGHRLSLLPPGGQRSHFFPKPLASHTLTHCICGPKRLLQRRLVGGDARGAPLEVALIRRFFSLPFLLVGQAILESKLRRTWSLSLCRGVRTLGRCPPPPKTRKQEGTRPH